MCYPKPGPRCSGHAGQRLASATKRAAKDPTGVNRAAVLDASDAYDATPKGMAGLAAAAAAAATPREAAATEGRLAAAVDRRRRQTQDYEHMTGRVLPDSVSESLPDQDDQPAATKAARRDFEGEYAALRTRIRLASTHNEQGDLERQAAKVSRAAERAGVVLDETALDEQSRQDVVRRSEMVAAAPVDALYEVDPGLAGKVASTVVHGQRTRVSPAERDSVRSLVPAGHVRFFADGDQTWMEKDD